MIYDIRNTYQSPWKDHEDCVGKTFVITGMGWEDDGNENEPAAMLFRIRMEDGQEFEVHEYEVFRTDTFTFGGVPWNPED